MSLQLLRGGWHRTAHRHRKARGDQHEDCSNTGFIVLSTNRPSRPKKCTGRGEFACKSVLAQRMRGQVAAQTGENNDAYFMPVAEQQSQFTDLAKPRITNYSSSFPASPCRSPQALPFVSNQDQAGRSGCLIVGHGCSRNTNNRSLATSLKPESLSFLPSKQVSLVTL